jgi:N-acetylmuramoyl-L-alanine amidase
MLVVKARVAGEEVFARVPLYPRSDGDYVALDQFASRLSMELQRTGKRGTLLWQEREARFSAGSRQVTVGVETVYLLRPVDEVDGRLFLSANSVDIVLEALFGVDVDASIVGGADAGSGRAFVAPQEREAPEVPAMAPGPAAEPAAPWSEIRTIVIDAGHGGRDTGVVGAGGLKEKDVTLNIASKLARLVEEDLGWKVVLTRGADYYVSLKDRCDIANTSQESNPGDLLLSIHANAAMNTQISGYQVFYPAKPREFALDEVVVLEGTGTGIGMRPERSNLISDIRRWDTQYRDYAAESRLLTTSLSTRLALGLRLADRTPRGAVLRLLRGVSMPAAAVEVGFLTNTAEEMSLNSETYQRRVAEALYDGLIEYRNGLLAVK